MEAVSAAPDRADEGQRRRADEEGRDHGEHARAVERHEQAEERRGERQRQAGGEPVGDRLGEDEDLQRRRRGAEQVERAVLLVGLEQAVEADQRREHGGEPEDGGADPGEQVEVGPEREGHQRHDHQEEHEPERAGAADAGGELEVAGDEGEERAAHAAGSGSTPAMSR